MFRQFARFTGLGLLLLASFLVIAEVAGGLGVAFGALAQLAAFAGRLILRQHQPTVDSICSLQRLANTKVLVNTIV